MNINDREVEQEIEMKKNKPDEYMQAEELNHELYNFSEIIGKTFKESKHYVLKWADYLMQKNMEVYFTIIPISHVFSEEKRNYCL